MKKKIRVTLPYSMYESLENDLVEFEIEKIGVLGNKILDFYFGRKIELIETKNTKGQVIQFNLNKKNEELFIEGLRKVQRDNNLKCENQLSDAEYIRNIFFNYLNNPKDKRERIIFNENVKEIQEAIKNRNKIKIKYQKNSEYRKISPYDILVGDRENRNYLLCWCDKSQDYRNYRIAKIQTISKSFDKREEKDENYLKELIHNFDPFRTYGSEVVATLTPLGEKILESAITNRPKKISIEEIKNDIGRKLYRFQCNEALGKVYFPQFLDEIEILEPESLREWFKEKYDGCVRVYEKN